MVLCREIGLFTSHLVAIDGSKFKAVNNRDRNFTESKLTRALQELDKDIGRYSFRTRQCRPKGARTSARRRRCA